MKFSKMALVMGSALALGAGLCVGTACSSSSSNTGGGSGGGSGSGSGGTVDSGSASDVTTGDDGGTTGDTGSPETDGGSGVDCGKLPTLHANPAGSIFCGYGPDVDAGGDGGTITCGVGSQCCLGGEVSASSGYSPQTCSTWTANGVGCDNPAADSGAEYAAIGIACNQNSDCTSNGQATGGSCCLVGATVSTVAGCSYPKAKSGTVIQCESTPSCASGEIQVCSAQADCPTGTTCTAGKWKLYDLGFCQ